MALPAQLLVVVGGAALTCSLSPQTCQNLGEAVNRIAQETGEFCGNAWSAWNESTEDYDGFEDVEEEYDSLEAAVGSVNPLDEVEYEGRTDNPGLREQGYTEKWSGVDADGIIQSAFKNPRTGRWTGGHPSSKNDKYW